MSASSPSMKLCRCGRQRERKIAGPDSSRPGVGYFRCECPSAGFEWETERNSLVAEGGPDCKCGVASVQRAVKKEGPNKGRKFWCCAKQSCNFFEFQEAAVKTPEKRKREDLPPLPGFANHLTDWATIESLQKMLDTAKLKAAYDTLEVAGAWRITNKQRALVYEAAYEKEQGGSTAGEGVPAGLREAGESLSIGRKLDADRGELLLLHGTAPGRLHNILFQGLDNAFAGDGLFGCGCYFGEDAAKIDGYAVVDARYEKGPLHEKLYSKCRHPKQVCYALVSRVLMGHPARTKDGVKTSDASLQLFTDGNRSQLSGGHTTLIAELGERIQKFREFVVFDRNKILVEYLVAYHRKRRNCDCGLPSTKRSVTKNTENHGRSIYMCPGKFDGGESSCNFLLMEPACHCYVSAKQKTSHSASNPNRKYWTCGSKKAVCDYFDWCDGASSSASSTPRKSHGSPSKMSHTSSPVIDLT